jgi:hypothetical protein
MMRTRMLTGAGVIHLAIAAVLFLTFSGQPTAVVTALGITPTADVAATSTSAPPPPTPTITPITPEPAPTETSVPTSIPPTVAPPPTAKPQSGEKAPIPTVTPIPILPISGEQVNLPIALLALGGAAIFFLLSWLSRRSGTGEEA